MAHFRQIFHYSFAIFFVLHLVVSFDIACANREETEYVKYDMVADACRSEHRGGACGGRREFVADDGWGYSSSIIITACIIHLVAIAHSKSTRQVKTELYSISIYCYLQYIREFMRYWIWRALILKCQTENFNG